MHVTAMNYCQEALTRIGGVHGLDVLEIGSHNVNGSVRELCAEARCYTGIDPWQGPGVDLVIEAANFNGNGQYDVVFSTEVMEHAPRPEEIVECAWRSLRPGGYLVVTAAGDQRPVHSCDGSKKLKQGEHYQNITTEEMASFLQGWNVMDLSYLPGACDVRAIAQKPGGL
jgi:SAM-dependent methyltransferase